MSVIEHLKTIQANAHSYYLQLHQIHWLVQGARFQAMHTLTEGYYEKMSELYDDAAERLLQKGLLPILQQDNLQAFSTIPPLEKVKFDEVDTLQYVENMVKQQLQSFTALALAAEAEEDRVTVSFADDKLAMLEKEEWMLLATKQEAVYQ